MNTLRINPLLAALLLHAASPAATAATDPHPDTTPATPHTDTTPAPPHTDTTSAPPHSELAALALMAATVTHNPDDTSLVRRIEAGYRDLLDRHPDHLPARVAFAEFLLTTNQFPEALDLLESLPPHDSAVEGLRLRLEIELSRGLVANAARTADQLVSLRPDSPHDHFQLANILYLFRMELTPEFGATPEDVLGNALTHFKTARDAAPHSAPLARAYAETFYTLANKDWHGALDAWRHVKSIDPSPFADTHIARVLIQMRRLDEAGQILDSISDPAFAPVIKALRARIRSHRHSPNQSPTPP